ncbi:hypothetical protein ACNOYE_27920 [Nannocystaceae bacterium ST9]
MLPPATPKVNRSEIAVVAVEGIQGLDWLDFGGLRAEITHSSFSAQRCWMPSPIGHKSRILRMFGCGLGERNFSSEPQDSYSHGKTNMILARSGITQIKISGVLFVWIQIGRSICNMAEVDV